MTTPINVAKFVLDDAASKVQFERQEEYGNPHENFKRIAALWSIVLATNVEPWQVALCMAQLKISRIMHNGGSFDSWTDLVGYAAIGAQLQMVTPPTEQEEG